MTTNGVWRNDKHVYLSFHALNPSKHGWVFTNLKSGYQLAASSSGCLTKGISNLTQVVGQINFFMVLWLKSIFPCYLLSVLILTNCRMWFPLSASCSSLSQVKLISYFIFGRSLSILKPLLISSYSLRITWPLKCKLCHIANIP
jgi:hypothetical protein